MRYRAQYSRVFEALADPYRRQLLLALSETNPQSQDGFDPLNLGKEKGAPNDVRATQIHLKHVHLPKLEEMGFIEWNRTSGEISKGPDWDEIDSFVSLLNDHRDDLPDGWLSGSASDD